jgi:hypothetical protein
MAAASVADDPYLRIESIGVANSENEAFAMLVDLSKRFEA